MSTEQWTWIAWGGLVVLYLAGMGWLAYAKYKGKEDTDLFDSALTYWATVLVKAAEQMLSHGTGADRLAYVVARLSERFPNLSEERIRAVIEWAVFNLNQRAERKGIEGPEIA